nr:fructose-6-phosphate aldolase [Rufibacter sediminis]
MVSNASKVYIIKVKGKAKIPDYIQLRDENFVLIAYFRADRPLKNLDRYGLDSKEEELAAVIAGLEFGKLQKLEI